MRHWSSDGAVTALAVQVDREVLTPEQALANAIVEQAAIDYINALLKNNRSGILSGERFFESAWYQSLTALDGRYLMKLCHRQAEECVSLGMLHFKPYRKRGLRENGRMDKEAWTRDRYR